MKKTNKFLAITAALTIGFSGLTSIYTAQPVAKANELQELKDKKSKLQADAKKIREEIQDLENKMVGSHEKIDELTKENERLAKEIEETTVKLEEKKAELGATLQATQKAGKVGMIDVIFGGKDFTDTMNRVELVNTLTTDQKEKVKVYDALENKLQQDKAKTNENLQSMSKELESLEAAKSNHTTKLNSLTEEQRAVIAEIVAKEESERERATVSQQQPQGQSQQAPSSQNNSTSILAANPTIQADGSVISASSRWLGMPYRLGSNGSNGFIDCSAFTQNSFAAIGKRIPRNSAAQYAGGQKVSRDALQPGDIVAFAINSSRVSHVGIYLGGGQFRHADFTKGVSDANLGNSYWSKYFVGGARY